MLKVSGEGTCKRQLHKQNAAICLLEKLWWKVTEGCSCLEWPFAF